MERRREPRASRFTHSSARGVWLHPDVPAAQRKAIFLPGDASRDQSPAEMALLSPQLSPGQWFPSSRSRHLNEPGESKRNFEVTL